MKNVITLERALMFFFNIQSNMAAQKNGVYKEVALILMKWRNKNTWQLQSKYRTLLLCKYKATCINMVQFSILKVQSGP